MPRKIFKYQLSLQAVTNDLTMPAGAEVRATPVTNLEKYASGQTWKH